MLQCAGFNAFFVVVNPVGLELKAGHTWHKPGM
jgi:hypothetical protein